MAPIIFTAIFTMVMQTTAPAFASGLNAGPMCADLFKPVQIESPVAVQIPANQLRAIEAVTQEALQDVEARTLDYEANFKKLTDSKDAVKRIQKLKQNIEWYRKKNLWWETREEIDTKLSASRFESFLIWNMPDLARKHYELLFNTTEASGFELIVSKNLIRHLQDEVNAGRIDRNRGEKMIASATKELETARETFRGNYLQYRPLRLVVERIQTQRKMLDTNLLVSETYSDLAGIKRAERPKEAAAETVPATTPNTGNAPNPNNQLAGIIDLGNLGNIGINGGVGANPAQPTATAAGGTVAIPPVATAPATAPAIAPTTTAPGAKPAVLALSDEQIDRLVLSAKMVDEHFAGFWETQPIKDSFAGIRKTLGAKFALRRPTLHELDQLYREESLRTEAINERLERELTQERKLFVRLMFVSPESVDAVTDVITAASQKLAAKPFVWFFKPLLEMCGLSRDAVVRRRFLPSVFEIISMNDGPDGMARLNALRTSNIHFKKDQLLITYARMVNGTETWQQMKDKVETLAYDKPKDASRRVISQIWANFDARLDSAVTEADKQGDLALSETVSPFYVGGIVIRSAVPAASWALYHSPYFDQAITFIQHVLPVLN
jgi:hypothetical protein